MRQFLMAGLLLGLAAFASPVVADEKPIVLGIINDMSGPYSDFGGKGSILAAKMAAEDAGRVLGRPVQIIFADHQNKPDLGAAIARQWYDDGMDAIVDVGNSAVALAVQQVSREKHKIVLVVGGSVSI